MSDCMSDCMGMGYPGLSHEPEPDVSGRESDMLSVPTSSILVYCIGIMQSKSNILV